ncbi:MAG: ribosomal L7Ae/L30e/S12e/Gadd45 family protein [Eubacterium sp.]|nr:ribosomal L7Ae/L30e/S12e/Gadd45 family protein [Eubacterium sp.]
MIGLATRAGQLVSGEFSVENKVKSGLGKLVIVAEDASENTKKSYTDMCSFYQTPIRIFGTKEKLGQWSGKAYRASICILDEGFAKSVIKRIDAAVK